MAFGSVSGWRPLERIDAVVRGTRGVVVIRAVHWWSTCQTAACSVTVRNLSGNRSDVVERERLGRDLGLRPEATVVDAEAYWYELDGTRGLRCPALGVTMSVRVPRPRTMWPAAKVSRVFRRVLVDVDDTEVAGAGPGRRVDGGPGPRAGTGPGVYTRWPLLVDTDPESVLGVTPAGAAAGPTPLFRESEDRQLVG